MRMKLLGFVISLVIAAPGLATAQHTPPPPEPATAGGPYFSGELALGGAPSIAAPGIYEASIDYTSGLAGGIGYRMGPVRLEGQLRYDHFDVSSMNPVPGSPLGSPETAVNFGGWGLMANAFYDFGTVGKARPYIGAGMGLVDMSAQEEDFEFCFVVCLERSPVITGSDTVMAWQAMAGLTIPASWIGGEWQVGYRYYRTDDMQFHLEGYGPFTQEGLESHSVTFGVRHFLN
jgi:opacity protein-like surface antigen